MITNLEVEDLRATITGQVLQQADAEFEAASQSFNQAVRHLPSIVVLPHSATDVAAALAFAEAQDLRVQVQSTGHGIGLFSQDGMLINTSKMDRVRIDPDRKTARVGAGATWNQVIEAAAPYGLAPLNGSSVTVGVVGYIMGGGMGPMARTFGFAADHVRSMELVTAQGDIVTVNHEQTPELFWALCGGKCSVGVVTEIEFDLMDVAEVYGGGIFFPGEEAHEVLHAYGRWITSVPDSVTSSIALLRMPDIDMIPEPLRGKLSVHLRFVHVGDLDQGEALLAPMRSSGTPVFDLVRPMPYSAIAMVHQDPEEPMPAWDGSKLLRELPPAAIDAILDAAGPDVDVPLIMAEIRYMGGALNREPARGNAVGGRDAAFSVMAIGPYPPALQEAVSAAGTAVLRSVEP